MISVSSINRFPVTGFQTQGSREAIIFTSTHQNSLTGPATTANTVTADQLPQGPARKAAALFRNINILAGRASEPAQALETREVMQTEVAEDLSELQSVFDQLSRDDLTLFIAVFQNQLPNLMSNSGGGSFSSQLTEDLLGNVLDTIFSIDVTTESGALKAFELSDSLGQGLMFPRDNASLLASMLASDDDRFQTAALAVGQGRITTPPEVEPSKHSDQIAAILRTNTNSGSSLHLVA